jgi:hypothetical protein
MGNFDFQHDQYLLNGANLEDEDEEQVDVCGSCGWSNCQCDAAHDYQRDN